LHVAVDGGMAGISTKGAQYMRGLAPYLALALLAAACFSLAANLQPGALTYSQSGQDNALKVVLGDARYLFANQLFTEADIYLHSGYYPSIFDKNSHPHENHVTAHEDEDHEEETDFLGPPKDIIEKFGRHFMVTEHSHLRHGQEKELLPWLQLSADLDPQITATYTVAAYWLTKHLNKPAEAEQFLRRGLEANPKSYEILFSLGEIYLDYDHDTARARNVLELALRRWREQEPQKEKPNNLALDGIANRLGHLEEDQGNYAKAISYFELAKTVSPNANSLQEEIDKLKQKVGKS
jgi:tetratricopeptide (TPR) repeat protein